MFPEPMVLGENGRESFHLKEYDIDHEEHYREIKIPLHDIWLLDSLDKSISVKNGRAAITNFEKDRQSRKEQRRNQLLVLESASSK